MPTSNMLTKVLTDIEAANLGNFKDKHFESASRQLAHVGDLQLEEFGKSYVKEGDKSQSFISYCLNRVTKKSVKKTNPDKWFIIDDVCYRCGNSGVVLDIVVSKEGDAHESAWECDCKNATPFYGRKANEKDELEALGNLYSEKYGDDHQFPFTKEIILSTENRIDYSFVYLICKNEFLNLFREDTTIKPGFNLEFVKERLGMV